MDHQAYEESYKDNFISNKDFNLGTCWPENEELHESKEYKQVFTAARSYIKNTSFSAHNDRERFPVSCSFNSIIKQNQSEGVKNTWGSLSSVFLLLTWYSLRILRAPWRKSYFKIKAYSGHFQHLVYSNFTSSVTQQLMAKLGYIFHQPNQTYLFHQQTWSTTSWRDSLTHVGMDFFLVHVRCSICSTQTGSLMPVCDITTGIGSETLKIEHKTSTKEALKKLTSSSSFKADVNSPNTVSKVENSSRHHFFNNDRIEASPNRYVKRDTMLRHHKVRESESSSVPWQHRLQVFKLNEDASSFSDEGADLYRGDDDPSVIGADIRYPPNDLGFNFSAKEKDKRVANFQQITSSLSRSQDNYVTALPMSSHHGSSKTMLPRGNRVESGYYSEWLHSPLSHIDKRADAARRKEAGEYVYGFPHKRSPADGQPTSPPPLYHEIIDDKSPAHHLTSNSSGSVRR